MSDRRRQEIEEKKAKLAELRRARDERKALLAQAEKGPGAAEVRQAGKQVLQHNGLTC